MQSFKLEMGRVNNMVYSRFFVFCMLFISVFAIQAKESTNDTDEIGIPVRPLSTLQPYFMVLAPKGERAYVMFNDMLVQYQLNPLKIISVVDIDLKIPPLDRKHPRTSLTPKRLFITQDEKRIIIYGHAYMKLFDIAMNKVIKTINLNKGSAILNGNEFVTFEKDSVVVTIWNAQDLTQNRKINSGGRGENESKTLGTFNAHKVGEYIFAHSGSMFRILDSKTYEEIFSFKLHDLTVNTVPWVDYNFKMLVVYYASIPTSYGGNGGMAGYRKYNLKERRLESVSGSFNAVMSSLKNIRLFTRSAIQVSPTNLYSSSEGLLTYPNFYKMKSLFQFPDGEAVLWNVIDKKFQATKNARKHMTMKNSYGEIMPMNDETFNKYNQAGISHLEW